MLYRVALQTNTTSMWQWKSTVLSSLHALFLFLRIYRALPQDHLRVFSARSREEMDELLIQENRGLASGSVTAAQFLQELGLSVPATSTETAERQQTKAQVSESIDSVAASAPQALSKHTTMAYSQTQEAFSTLDCRRLAMEIGPGGDHDIPYSFTMPISMPQTLAWIKLLAKVQRGELEP